MQNWTEVQQEFIDPAKLRRHPLQEAHWAEIKGKSYTALEASVISTGIQTPLLAYAYGLKKGEDPWLLAGYRRQRICLDNNIEKVPVRIMRKQMNKEEIELIILSNNLAARVIGWRKDEKEGHKWKRFINLTEKYHTKAFRMLENNQITVEEFSGRTGIDEKVSRKLKRVVRVGKAAKVNATRARIYPNSIDTTIIRGVSKSVGSILKNITGTNQATRNKIIKVLTDAVKTISAIK